MDITTVKIHKKTKMAMDEIKPKNETYDDVITRPTAKAKRQNLVKELVEGYKVRAKENLEILEDWEAASEDLDD